jgi:hypothetical protein
LSWACWFSVVISQGQADSSEITPVQNILLFLGTITPSLVALWLVSRSEIHGQTEMLLGKITKWEVNIKWYLFAAGFMLVVKLSVAVLYQWITGVWPVFGTEAWLYYSDCNLSFDLGSGG